MVIINFKSIFKNITYKALNDQFQLLINNILIHHHILIQFW